MRVGGAGGFALSVEVEEDAETHQLGSGWKQGTNGEAAERRNRIDRVPVASSRAFCDHVRLVWLTPAMDSLFAGPASERRRFLDRFVLAIDPNHGARVGQFERALRGRNRLLEEGGRNAAWLDAIEREAAELGVAVAAARLDCVTPARSAHRRRARRFIALSLGEARASRRDRGHDRQRAGAQGGRRLPGELAR